MELKKGKVLGIKLTDERIESIKVIFDFLQIDYLELSAASLFDEILKGFLNRISKDIDESKTAKTEVIEVKPEFSEVKISKPDFNISGKLSSFHRTLISLFINKTQIINDFSDMNKNGKLNGVFNPINTDNEEENILNLLTGVFTGSANGLILKKGILEKNDLKAIINDYIKENE